MSKSFKAVFETLTQFNDEERDLFARCLADNPEDDGTEADLALMGYDAMKENFDLDESSLSLARKNFPAIARKALSLNEIAYCENYGGEEAYLLGARMSREDLKEEIESYGQVSSVTTPAVQTCLKACENASEEDGEISMADFHDALTEALKGCAADGRALAFLRSCPDDEALELMKGGADMGTVGAAFGKECRWIEAMAFLCR